MAELSRLPLPLFSNYEWCQRGACVEGNPHLFFHPEGERGPARAQRDQAAVAVCSGCLVIDACRRHGLSVQEPYGVWGGLTESDRRSLTAHRQHAGTRAGSAELAG